MSESRGELYRMLRVLMRFLYKIIEAYIKSVADMLEIIGLRIQVKLPSIFRFEISPGVHETVDERLAKINAARSNLRDVLEAMDELEREAKRSKTHVDWMRFRLAEIESSKESAEKELEDIKNIINVDVESFRRVAGIPSSGQVRRQRFLGFLSGVFASILAALICWGVAALFTWSKHQEAKAVQPQPVAQRISEPNVPPDARDP